MWKWLARIALTLVLLAALAGALELSFFPTYTEVCEQNKDTKKEECSRDHVTFFLIRVVVEFFDAHNASVTALSGIAVAAFTLALKVSTDRLWKAGERALEITERAFVFLDGFNVELTTAADGKAVDIENLPERYRSEPGLFITRFAVQPRWKNGGSTPTKRMRIQVDWSGPTGTIPPEYEYRSPSESFFLAPKATEPSGFIEIPSAAVIVDYAMNYMGSAPMIFIWGRTDYRDVFGREHFFQWCYQLRFERHDGKKLRAGFIQWGDYNRSDEDNHA